MLAEFHVVPIGTGESMSEQIAKLFKLVEAGGLPYKATPMGTVIEGEWDEVMGLIKKCHQTLLAEWPRVLTSISIDDRGEKKGMLEGKLKSVEEKLGKKLEK